MPANQIQQHILRNTVSRLRKTCYKNARMVQYPFSTFKLSILEREKIILKMTKTHSQIGNLETEKAQCKDNNSRYLYYF